MSDESYYKILDYLDERVKIDSDISEDALKEFKGIIRDNKYVSTYIRSLENNIKDLKNVEDYKNQMTKFNSSNTDQMKRDYSFLVHHSIRNIMNYPHENKDIPTDPIKIINKLVWNAIEREGKICDGKDSIHPKNKLGMCESEEHDEIENEEPTELTRCWYADEDTNKWDDENPVYVCSTCLQNDDNNDGCDVSCDMG